MLVGIVGAGALGSLIAASLGRRHDVRVLARDAVSARAIRHSGGLQIEGEPSSPARVTAAAEDLRDAEVVIVTVKTFATRAALEPLRKFVADTTPIVSLQNGIEAVESIDAALGTRRALALGPTTEAATRLGPGLIRRSGHGTTLLGWAAGHDGGIWIEELARAFTASGLRSDVVRPVEPHVWAKLVANAAINPVTALAAVPNGALLVQPELQARAAALAREAAAVARAASIVLPFEDPVAHVMGIAQATAANRSSMLADVERGRETEIEALDGAIVRLARRLGVPVPETERALNEVRTRTKA